MVATVTEIAVATAIKNFLHDQGNGPLPVISTVTSADEVVSVNFVGEGVFLITVDDSGGMP